MNNLQKKNLSSSKLYQYLVVNSGKYISYPNASNNIPPKYSLYHPCFWLKQSIFLIMIDNYYNEPTNFESTRYYQSKQYQPTEIPLNIVQKNFLIIKSQLSSLQKKENNSHIKESLVRDLEIKSCSKCSFSNYEWKQKCNKCNESPGPEDWRCLKYSYINYARQNQVIDVNRDLPTSFYHSLFASRHGKSNLLCKNFKSLKQEINVIKEIMQFRLYPFYNFPFLKYNEQIIQNMQKLNESQLLYYWLPTKKDIYIKATSYQFNQKILKHQFDKQLNIFSHENYLKNIKNQIKMQTQLDINIPPRYINFNKWIHLNGCKIDPRVRIPSLQQGVIGVSTKSEIQQNTVIMAIPQKLIITVQKCYNGELKQLYAADDQLFDYEASDDAEFNILSVFIMYEKGKIVKGKKQAPGQQFYSFWQPYIECVQSSQTGMDWSDQQLKGLHNEILEQINHFKKQINTLSHRVVNFLLSRRQFQGITKECMYELFHYSYKFIMTRCFGYCTPGTSLIPLADLMNHNCEGISHQLINMNKEKNKVTQKYQLQSGKIDLSLLNGDPKNEENLDPIIQFLKENTQLSLKQILLLKRKEREQMINDIQKQQLKESNIYDINFYSESDNQDNDTESDEQQKRDAQMKMIEMQQKEQRQLFKNQLLSIKVAPFKQVKETLQMIEQKEKQIEKNEKKQKQNEKKTFQQIQKLNQNQNKETINTFLQNMECKPQTPLKQQNLSTNQSEEKQKFKQEIKELLLEKMKDDDTKKQLFEQISRPSTTIKFKDEQGLKSSSSSSDSEQQQEQQQEFPWFKQQGTYFTISTFRRVKSNQQLYNCYGCRTNKFLLIWYGFTYPQNLYDSVTFRFYVNFSHQKNLNNLIFDHYYGGRGLIKGFRKEDLFIKSNEVSKEFRLKKSRIDRKLLIFLRLFLMNQYKGDDLCKLFATFPSSIQYELFVFDFLIKIIQKLYERYPLSNLEQWKKNQENYRVRFKIIFYEGQRKILDDNMLMIKSIILILNKIKEDKTISLKQIYQSIKSFEILRKIREYIREIEENLQYINYQGEQIDEDDEQQQQQEEDEQDKQ